ncbi:uncharacterized protein LOC116339816 [Contarinia nasturtii]|uniref:uncharacterized protein LOC116339816 n=1 Tax=Contarinia nasturtii TaxID=265458 RepID=UPI0012D4AB7D|nr:uncharacterized protein LOC116339816 [Contarinia nasturtii]
MNYFLIFALFSCGVLSTWATKPASEDSMNPALVTVTTLLGKVVCGPVSALACVGVGQAAVDGLKKYRQTKDITLATTEAGEQALARTSELFKYFGTAARSSVDVVKEIQNSGNAKAVLAQRTKEVINYFKEELKTNPKGKVASALITGGNVAITWTVGPMTGWAAATVAVATADGLQKYKETENVAEATKFAAKSGLTSASNLMKTICGLVSSSVGLAKDVSTGKGVKSSLQQRGNQALQSLASMKKTN